MLGYLLDISSYFGPGIDTASLEDDPDHFIAVGGVSNSCLCSCQRKRRRRLTLLILLLFSFVINLTAGWPWLHYSSPSRTSATMIITRILLREETSDSHASPSIKLHNADIALICIFVVLFCFTISYLVLWKDPKTQQRSRVFRCFQNILNPRRRSTPVRKSRESSARSAAGPDVRSLDLRDVEKVSDIQSGPGSSKPTDGIIYDEGRHLLPRLNLTTSETPLSSLMLHPKCTTSSDSSSTSEKHGLIVTVPPAVYIPQTGVMRPS